MSFVERKCMTACDNNISIFIRRNKTGTQLRLPLAALYLYTRLLIRSQCACARFCDRPTQPNSTVVFVDSIESAELVCKRPVCSPPNKNLKVPLSTLL